MAGRVALMIHTRPSDLLGFHGTELERFLLDAMILAQAAEELEKAVRLPRSTKELIRWKRARWKPPRRMMT